MTAKELRHLQMQNDALAEDDPAKDDKERKCYALTAEFNSDREREEARQNAVKEELRKQNERLKARAERIRQAQDEAERKCQELTVELDQLRKQEDVARDKKENAEQTVHKYDAQRQRVRQIMECSDGYEWFKITGGWC